MEVEAWVRDSALFLDTTNVEACVSEVLGNLPSPSPALKVSLWCCDDWNSYHIYGQAHTKSIVPVPDMFSRSGIYEIGPPGPC